MDNHILLSVSIRDNQALFNTSTFKKIKPMGSRVSLPIMDQGLAGIYYDVGECHIEYSTAKPQTCE